MASWVSFAAAASLLLLIVSCNGSGFSGKPKKPNTVPAAPVSAEAVGPKPSSVDSLGRVTDYHLVSYKVDIVFAIDTSPSMDDKLVAMQNNLQKMIGILNQGKLDFRIHLMLDAPIRVPPGTDPERVAIIKETVESNNAIGMLNTLFSGDFAKSYQSISYTPLPTPLAFRKDAKLEIVVISDDDGFGEGNHAHNFDYSDSLNSTFSGIIALPTTVETDTCGIANIGTEYMFLAERSGGTTLDICSSDWSKLITTLSDDMVQRSNSFRLSKKPLNPKAMKVKLNGQDLGPNDYLYHADGNFIRVNAALVKFGLEIAITYEPAS